MTLLPARLKLLLYLIFFCYFIRAFPSNNKNRLCKWQSWSVASTALARCLAHILGNASVDGPVQCLSVNDAHPSDRKWHFPASGEMPRRPSFKLVDQPLKGVGGLVRFPWSRRSAVGLKNCKRPPCLSTARLMNRICLVGGVMATIITGSESPATLPRFDDSGRITEIALLME